MESAWKAGGEDHLKELVDCLTEWGEQGLTDSQVLQFLELRDNGYADPEEIACALRLACAPREADSDPSSEPLYMSQTAQVVIDIENFSARPRNIQLPVGGTLQFASSKPSRLTKLLLQVEHTETSKVVLSATTLGGDAPCTCVLSEPGEYTFSSEIYSFLRGIVHVMEAPDTEAMQAGAPAADVAAKSPDVAATQAHEQPAPGFEADTAVAVVGARPAADPSVTKRSPSSNTLDTITAAAGSASNPVGKPPLLSGRSSSSLSNLMAASAPAEAPGRSPALSNMPNLHIPRGPSGSGASDDGTPGVENLTPTSCTGGAGAGSAKLAPQVLSLRTAPKGSGSGAGRSHAGSGKAGKGTGHASPSVGAHVHEPEEINANTPAAIAAALHAVLLAQNSPRARRSIGGTPLSPAGTGPSTPTRGPIHQMSGPLIEAGTHLIHGQGIAMPHLVTSYSNDIDQYMRGSSSPQSHRSQHGSPYSRVSADASSIFMQGGQGGGMGTGGPSHHSPMGQSPAPSQVSNFVDSNRQSLRRSLGGSPLSRPGPVARGMDSPASSASAAAAAELQHAHSLSTNSPMRRMARASAPSSSPLGHTTSMPHPGTQVHMVGSSGMSMYAAVPMHMAAPAYGSLQHPMQNAMHQGQISPMMMHAPHGGMAVMYAGTPPRSSDWSQRVAAESMQQQQRLHAMQSQPMVAVPMQMGMPMPVRGGHGHMDGQHSPHHGLSHGPAGDRQGPGSPKRGPNSGDWQGPGSPKRSGPSQVGAGGDWQGPGSPKHGLLPRPRGNTASQELEGVDTQDVPAPAPASQHQHQSGTPKRAEGVGSPREVQAGGEAGAQEEQWEEEGGAALNHASQTEEEEEVPYELMQAGPDESDTAMDDPPSAQGTKAAPPPSAVAASQHAPHDANGSGQGRSRQQAPAVHAVHAEPYETHYTVPLGVRSGVPVAVEGKAKADNATGGDIYKQGGAKGGVTTWRMAEQQHAMGGERRGPSGGGNGSGDDEQDPRGQGRGRSRLREGKNDEGLFWPLGPTEPPLLRPIHHAKAGDMSGGMQHHGGGGGFSSGFSSGFSGHYQQLRATTSMGPGGIGGGGAGGGGNNGMGRGGAGAGGRMDPQDMGGMLYDRNVHFQHQRAGGVGVGGSGGMMAGGVGGGKPEGLGGRMGMGPDLKASRSVGSRDGGSGSLAARRSASREGGRRQMEEGGWLQCQEFVEREQSRSTQWEWFHKYMEGGLPQSLALQVPDQLFNFNKSAAWKTYPKLKDTTQCVVCDAKYSSPLNALRCEQRHTASDPNAGALQSNKSSKGAKAKRGQSAQGGGGSGPDNMQQFQARMKDQLSRFWTILCQRHPGSALQVLALRPLTHDHCFDSAELRGGQDQTTFWSNLVSKLSELCNHFVLKGQVNKGMSAHHAMYTREYYMRMHGMALLIAHAQTDLERQENIIQQQQVSKGEAKAESKDLAQQVQPSFQLPSWEDISCCLEKVTEGVMLTCPCSSPAQPFTGNIQKRLKDLLDFQDPAKCTDPDAALALLLELSLMAALNKEHERSEAALNSLVAEEEAHRKKLAAQAAKDKSAAKNKNTNARKHPSHSGSQRGDDEEEGCGGTGGGGTAGGSRPGEASTASSTCPPGGDDAPMLLSAELDEALQRMVAAQSGISGPAAGTSGAVAGGVGAGAPQAAGGRGKAGAGSGRPAEVDAGRGRGSGSGATGEEGRTGGSAPWSAPAPSRPPRAQAVPGGNAASGGPVDGRGASQQASRPAAPPPSGRASFSSSPALSQRTSATEISAPIATAAAAAAAHSVAQSGSGKLGGGAGGFAAAHQQHGSGVGATGAATARQQQQSLHQQHQHNMHQQHQHNMNQQHQQALAAGQLPTKVRDALDFMATAAGVPKSAGGPAAQHAAGTPSGASAATPMGIKPPAISVQHLPSDNPHHLHQQQQLQKSQKASPSSTASSSGHMGHMQANARGGFISRTSSDTRGAFTPGHDSAHTPSGTPVTPSPMGSMQQGHVDPSNASMTQHGAGGGGHGSMQMMVPMGMMSPHMAGPMMMTMMPNQHGTMMPMMVPYGAMHPQAQYMQYMHMPGQPGMGGMVPAMQPGMMPGYGMGGMHMPGGMHYGQPMPPGQTHMMPHTALSPQHAGQFMPGTMQPMQGFNMQHGVSATGEPMFYAVQQADGSHGPAGLRVPSGTPVQGPNAMSHFSPQQGAAQGVASHQGVGAHGSQQQPQQQALHSPQMQTSQNQFGAGQQRQQPRSSGPPAGGFNSQHPAVSGSSLTSSGGSGRLDQRRGSGSLPSPGERSYMQHQPGFVTTTQGGADRSYPQHSGPGSGPVRGGERERDGGGSHFDAASRSHSGEGHIPRPTAAVVVPRAHATVPPPPAPAVVVTTTAPTSTPAVPTASATTTAAAPQKAPGAIAAAAVAAAAAAAQTATPQPRSGWQEAPAAQPGPFRPNPKQQQQQQPSAVPAPQPTAVPAPKPAPAADPAPSQAPARLAAQAPAQPPAQPPPQPPAQAAASQPPAQPAAQPPPSQPPASQAPASQPTNPLGKMGGLQALLDNAFAKAPPARPTQPATAPAAQQPTRSRGFQADQAADHLNARWEEALAEMEGDD